MTWRNDLHHRRFHEVCVWCPEAHWIRVLGYALDVLDDPGTAVDEVPDALDNCAESEVLDLLADVLFDHYVFEDEIEHHDSAGNHGIIGPGDVQWMTAGDGIVHSEMTSECLQTEGDRVMACSFG